jgi:hypothetical protein
MKLIIRELSDACRGAVGSARRGGGSADPPVFIMTDSRKTPGSEPAPPSSLAQAASAAPFDSRRLMHWLVHVGSPLGISLTLHAIILIIFAALTAAVARQSSGDADVEYAAMVVTSGQAGGAGGGFRFPGHAMIDQPDQSRKSPGVKGATRLSDLLDRDRGIEIPKAGGLANLTESLSNSSLTRSDIIGTGTGGAIGAPALGSGAGDRDVAGGGPIGSLWGVGEGQVARSIVYVVDRSASFIDWVEAIDRELKKSIGILKDDQLFNIIFLRDNKPLPLKSKLVPAELAVKKEAFAWINMYVPAGGSDLTPAVRLAVRHEPDIMFIVTDYELMVNTNQGTDLEELLGVVRDARRKRNMTVNVVLMGPFERPKESSTRLKAEIAALGDGGSSARREILRQQLDLQETIEAIEKLPAETGGTLRYLNGDELMAQVRQDRARREGR